MTNEPLDIFASIQPLVSKQIDDALNAYANKAQFNVVDIPSHSHTGVESPNVSFDDVINRKLYINYCLPGTLPATSSNYSVFFIVPFACTVVSVSEVHTVKGTDAGSVFVGLDKLTGTQGPGGGSSILSGGNVIDLKGAINTIVSYPISQLAIYNNLAAGDRLSLNLSGTPTSVANLIISIILTY